MKRFFLILTFVQTFIGTMNAGSTDNGKLSKQQAIDDLDSLVYMLCEVHPNVVLCVYTYRIPFTSECHQASIPR